MLKTLRSKTKIVMWAALILVIPSFVLFYGWTQIENRAVMGTDFVTFTVPDSNRYGIPGLKKKVSLNREEVKAAREEMQKDLSSLLGPDQVAAMVQYFGEEQFFPIRDEIKGAVDSWVLYNYANKKGITVSDQEVRKEMSRRLSSIEVKPGESREEVYTRVLQSQGMSPASFAQSIRNEMLLFNAELAIKDQGRLSLDELWKDHLMREQKLKVDYVAFKMDDYKDKVTVDDAALKKYFQDNQEKFRVGDQRQYRFAYFSKDSLTSDVVVNEKTLGDYFEANKGKYNRGPSVHVRQIYFPIPMNETTKPEDIQNLAKAALKKAEAAKALLDKKTDFATVANQMSEDPDNTSIDGKTKLGGLVTQWISDSDTKELGQDYVKAALGLKLGAISDITAVKDGKYSGFVILKCEETRPESTTSLEEVKPKVEADFRAQELEKKFTEKRQEIEKKMKDLPEIDKLAKAAGMKEGRTSWTLVSSPVIAPELGVIARENMDYITELKPGDRSVLLSSPDVHFIVQVINQRASFIPKFEEIQAKVESAYRLDKGREMALAAAKDFVKKSPNFDAMKASAASEKLNIKTTDFFTREKMPEGMPSPLMNFMRESLNAKPGAIRLSEIGSAEEQSGAVVWHLKEVQDPDRAKFLKDVPTLQRDLLILKQRAILHEWLWDQRKSLDIKINPSILKSES